jgi:hypothetical protein
MSRPAARLTPTGVTSLVAPRLPVVTARRVVSAESVARSLTDSGSRGANLPPVSGGGLEAAMCFRQVTPILSVALRLHHPQDAGILGAGGSQDPWVSL